ncbi:TM2 domain-containing protein 1-like isoform X1 [Carassius auratus]|uniref:TM2 domain-containing protein 1-like isoform X1 n=1 Tax=Carassius auratus TaxID=7957 RepID=A0A6P6J234_CARAU|nr:TM2 domain-containing protein 1-like isoform X1 [Carassius auratus]
MALRWRSLLCFRSTTRPLIVFTFCLTVIHSLGDEVDSCDKLRLGQYECKEPKIDDATQEPENCKDRLAWVECLPAPNISCRLSNGTQLKFSGKEVGFNKSIPCRNVSGYSYKVAVALSLFLGWIGADRFYLGYPALGLLKFCTVGFCGIGSLVDFMLISMQVDPNEMTHQMYRIVLCKSHLFFGHAFAVSKHKITWISQTTLWEKLAHVWSCKHGSCMC